MFSPLHWNLALSPLSLLLGLAPQLWHMWRPRRYSLLAACLGAVLVAGAACYDRDVTLVFTQILVLPLLWLRRKA